MNEARVIIVGGGAAGVAAATRLVQNGFQNVTVLEAEDRLGGRCETVAFGDGQVDLGAQWIHGETQNVVYEMAAPLNLTKDSIIGNKRFQFFLPDGKLMNPDVSKALYEHCVETFDRITEQKFSQNRVLLLDEGNSRSCNRNPKDLRDFAISNQEFCQKEELPLKVSLNKDYMKNLNDGQKMVKAFNNSNQEVCDGHGMLADLASASGEVQNKCFYKNIDECGITSRETFKKQALSSNNGLSLGEVFRKSFKENLKDLDAFKISDQEIRLFLEWYDRNLSSIEAADSCYDLSFEGYLMYKHCEGNQVVAWKTGGYSNIIDLLLQKIPDSKPEISLNVLFGKEVTEIKRNSEVVVKCADGSVFSADHVIVTVSLGVLKCAQSMFSPSLPAHKRLAIDTIALGCGEKLFLQFSQRWWPQDVSSLCVLLDSHAEEELQRIGKSWLAGVVAFFVLDNAPNTLCAWVGANPARYISKLPDDALRDDLHYLLTRYLSNVYTIPAPIRFVRSNWFGNPHFRGTYSFTTTRANFSRSSRDDLAAPILDKSKPVLMFAGEATHPHYSATVHGAVETGWREADRLRAFYT